MRPLLLLIFLIPFSLFAESSADKLLWQNEPVEPPPSVEQPAEPVKMEDMSGLSDDEVRDIAEKADKEKKQVTIEEVIQATDSNGSVDVKKLQSSWEELSPTPDGYDWVQTKSGEWFKGEIKALYDKKLEFDSDEIDLYTFDFEDVTQIKSYQILSVNIEDTALYQGILRLKGDTITIIQGDKRYEFQRDQIISFAPIGELERQNWSGKITLSIDKRSGNRNQFDYTARANIQRRTAKTRLRLDYLGRISESGGYDTANDHRINEKFDIYLSRRFFWTPLFSEYYTDEFSNIKHQYTVGTGLGYTIVDNKLVEWDVSGGPALIRTDYYTVAEGADDSTRSAALEIGTVLDTELTRITDLEFSYKGTFTDEEAGRYKHHMVLTLENELTSWLDLDLSLIWDHLQKPEEESDGNVPDKDDYQFLVGLGVDF